MKRPNLLTSFALAVILFTASCQYDYIVFEEPGSGLEEDLLSNCDPDTIYFKNTILPLVISSCGTTGCHDQTTHADGITLIDYASIIRTGKIKAGDPNDSEFFKVLSDDEDIMPPPPLSVLNTGQIEQIRDWILQGAMDNNCSDGCDTINVSFSASVWPLMTSYCTGCHSAANPGGGVVISNYDDMVAIANNGSLMGSILYKAGFAPMPPNSPMSDCQIIIVQKWIDKAMPND